MNKLPDRHGLSTARATRRPTRGSGTQKLAIAGALLAAAAVTNHLVARRSERRNPPRGRFVEAGGVRLHYLEKGTGPAVVLIHGNGVTSQDYALSGLLDRLSQSCRVIAFDRPGFGYSQRPQGRPWAAKDQAQVILEAMSRLGVDDAVLVAHSWGTLVALQAALVEPARVRGLVLMSGYYWPTPRLDVPLLSGPAIPGLGEVMRYTVSPPLGLAMTPLVMKQIFSPAAVAPHFKAGFETSMALRPSQLRATAADTARMPLEAAKIAGRYDEVRAPVLVISGDGDKIVSFKHQSRRLARELLTGQIQVIQGGGHMIHHTAPAEVAAGIETFIREIRPPAAAPDALQTIAEQEAGGVLTRQEPAPATVA
ncbi:alpha/beta hydrolase [Phenylobacterium sp.]|jgi:pimeloyl-ACP methyl ester carboxylesterase|uniref:alpha/beta fold hydrolase n=1 Tax=Phenylobacterium sp. TaxID=1871053 RepID=UPI002E35DF57|nr:alpha/beta hydrolase [Phenylobacterium sp.]HEX2560355.1 alpha/beta hydrolase [Phenylobacterium sp.]